VGNEAHLIVVNETGLNTSEIDKVEIIFKDRVGYDSEN
jgi:hypothetical protein